MSEDPIADIRQPNLAFHPQQIITEKEAARLRGISIDTFRRLVSRGEGPPRLRLSPGRIGYRLNDVLRIEEAR
jgi:predicted DNA-binding transcriptional regulator AlpA